MPGLVMFKRRWRIASDDFVFPSLAEFLLRLVWFVVVLAVFLQHRAHLQCQGDRLLHTYLVFSLAGLAFILFLDLMIAWISSRGTVTQTRPRRHLCKILYLRLLVMIAETVWNSIGTKWAFTPSDHSCEAKEVVILVQIIAVCSWGLITVILLGIVLVFDPIGSYKANGSGHRVSDVEHGEPQPLYINLNAASTEKAKKIWELQLRLFCCCGNQDEKSKSAYSDIAKLFTYHFEDVDLVPSDVAAGLILLQEKQSKENVGRVSTSHHSENYSVQSPDSLTSTGAVQGSILSSPGGVFSPPSSQFWMTPELACHFMKFAEGSYGWPLFLYSHCLQGMCQICTDMSCCGCCCKPPSYIVDDNCCRCHTAALKRATGLSDEDLIYVSFHNRVYEVPFCVAVDHSTCSVVVSVRGTLSPADALTDLTADCDKLFTDGCPQGVFCHRGMLRAAFFVKNKLEESHALSDAFALHQSYTLAITGHSLGAGTAALLAILLRPTYPNLRCYAFSPPGGLVSQEGTKYSEDFVMSVTLGDDLVPRLSAPNVEDMKRKLLGCILDSDVPKYKIFLHKFIDCFGGKKTPRPDASSAPLRPLLENFGQGNSSGNYTTNSSQEGSSEGSVSSNSASAQAARHSAPVPLYIPGRVLHITHADSSYTGRWVTVDYFNQIIISPRMVADHMPNAVHSALKQLVRNSVGNFP